MSAQTYTDFLNKPIVPKRKMPFFKRICRFLMSKKSLQNYEFDFSYWPVDFEYNNQQKYVLQTIKYAKKGLSLNKDSLITTLQRVFSSPQSIIGYIALHTVGIKIMYPGSISALNFIVQPTLQVGRKKLIEDKNGERFKIRTPDKNDLDVMFVDRRGVMDRGSTLVICTEGNAGFYEIGIMGTPIEMGYSVLGWNHPGFGSSTGTPYSDQELRAMDTVMQFAFDKLNFTPENIILFGWSIGGYASSFAATVYPEVQAIVLDATFDDILPLAQNQMPSIFSNIVKATIRNHANLDIGSNLVRYNGPIMLIRRSEDEIISLIQGDVSSNRGNHLVLKLMKHRYPKLIVDKSESAVWEWLSVTGQKQEAVFQKYDVDEQKLRAEYKSIEKRKYPSNLGEDWNVDKKTRMLLYIVSVYLRDFPTTHCTALPATLFQSVIDN